MAEEHRYSVHNMPVPSLRSDGSIVAHFAKIHPAVWSPKIDSWLNANCVVDERRKVVEVLGPDSKYHWFCLSEDEKYATVPRMHSYPPDDRDNDRPVIEQMESYRG